MTNNTNRIRAAADAFTTLDRLTACDCTETLPRSRNCIHFLASCALRDLLIARDAEPTFDFDDDAAYATALYPFMRTLLDAIDTAPYQTDLMTELLLSHSLCPLHAIDYAICFDDDDPDCAQIRAIHPSHDT